MAYNDNNLALLGNPGNVNATRTWVYKLSTDNEATMKASGYFDGASDRLVVDDVIICRSSDNRFFLAVLTNSAGVVTTVEFTTDQLEDGVVTNVKVNAAAAIDFSKLATLTSTNLLVGSSANVPTSTAITGDVTISNTGVTTLGNDKVITAKIIDVAVTTTKIANLAVTETKIDNSAVTVNKINDLAVTEAKIALNSLTGLVAANVADANVVGGIPVVHTINTAGGATANTDVTLTHKTRITYVTVQNNAAGTASDTITITDGSNNITNAISISGGDTSIAIVGTINDTFSTIAASGTLRVTETDGGGSDSPGVTVIVTGIRSA